LGYFLGLEQCNRFFNTGAFVLPSRHNLQETMDESIKGYHAKKTLATKNGLRLRHRVRQFQSQRLRSRDTL